MTLRQTLRVNVGGAPLSSFMTNSFHGVSLLHEVTWLHPKQVRDRINQRKRNKNTCGPKATCFHKLNADNEGRGGTEQGYQHGRAKKWRRNQKIEAHENQLEVIKWVVPISKFAMCGNATLNPMHKNRRQKSDSLFVCPMHITNRCLVGQPFLWDAGWSLCCTCKTYTIGKI